VNKAEIIDAIARHADISKAAAGRALDATIGAITTSLKQGDIVTLVGFGSFYVGKRKPRAGRNPRTGDTVQIPAKAVPIFTAGKAFQERVQSSAAPATVAAAPAAPQADAPAALQAAASSFFAGFSFPAAGTISALIPWDGGTVAPAAPSANVGGTVQVALALSSETGQAAVASTESAFELLFTPQHGFAPVYSDGQWTFVANFSSDWLSDWFT